MQPNQNYASDSIYGVIRAELCKNGLPQERADAVLQNLVDREDSMKGMWTHKGAFYPYAFLAGIFEAANYEAARIEASENEFCCAP